MKEYQEVPSTKYAYELFLIKNEEQFFAHGVLNTIYKFSQEANAIISLERLFKGEERALVLYAPQNIGQFIPELELLLIEDYISESSKLAEKKVSLNQSIVWAVEPKNEAELTISPAFLKDLNITPDQNFFWQIVMTAAKKDYHFQVNIRAMIAEKDVHKRIELAKKITAYIKQESGLDKKNKQETLSALFLEYQKRSLIPVEAEGFVLSSQTIKNLL